MSRARLKALKLVGFKSFADRTLVDFGPGISAVIGPNGSGKSNLADALRWALGEQGRTLRTRRAEDLIFAGSSVRRAQGMADVTLVIDNEDRLLPLDFGEVELGRRLFRSGENEYLLNRQRIRLRDLVDVLDEANLADNAFLFIGQGMVDQALALRPEERRPLFEEAAGTRKHERRRRAAEAELAEAEANLERVRDLLGELRPQARRLAAQAEQQAQRRDAGRELADGLVALARERLGSAGREAAALTDALQRAHQEADGALLALRAAEDTVGSVTAGMAAHDRDAAVARVALDGVRTRLIEARLAAGRMDGDGDALRRDRVRLEDEATVVHGRLDAAARDLALPPVDPDEAAEDGLRDVERRLADAQRELAEARESGRADAARIRRLRQEREARLAEAGRVRARAAEAALRLTEAEDRRSACTRRQETAGAAHREALDAATRVAAGETTTECVLDTARAELTSLEARARDATVREASARAHADALAARATALDELIGAGRSDTRTARAREAGGRAVTVGLEVEPILRRAVEGTLGVVLTGHVVPAAAVPRLGDVGGALVIAETPPSKPVRERESQARQAEMGALVAGMGGGLLTAALRRDPAGLVARLLVRAAWVPDLDGALRLVTGGALPAGWTIATPAGDVVDDTGVVRLAGGPSLLERRAERGDLEPAIAAAGGALVESADEARQAHERLAASRAAVEQARVALDTARRARRVADETERATSRAAETALREAGWAEAQRDRAHAAAAAAEAERAAIDEELADAERQATRASDADPEMDAATGVAAIEAQVALLSRDRDRWAATARVSRERLEADRERRRRAELRAAMDTAREEDIARELERLAGVEADLMARRRVADAELAEAVAEDARAASVLRALEIAGAGDRERLAGAEAAAGRAREQLRGAEARSRAAEVRALELRVQSETAREGLLVELAAIGPEGMAALQGVVGDVQLPRDRGASSPPTDDGSDQAVDQATIALEAALDAALDAWQAAPDAGAPAAGPPVPTSARLGALRRRYHDLGAGNPYAADELTELKVRLDALETQREDLERAIRSTRELIDRLAGLITQQFRTTFAALEGAFARRFTQLFDGGEAQLSLTAPDDLAATGVEITARPPGKKRQPLAMLSGGERSLTAVALLLAMLEVRPVPFCVLDEVDAALDEANVGRFSAALRGLAATIQFVVITHNRGTIEAADALYGVTVGDDAVSRVISLRLGDRAPDADAVTAAPSATGDRP